LTGPCPPGRLARAEHQDSGGRRVAATLFALKPALAGEPRARRRGEKSLAIVAPGKPRSTVTDTPEGLRLSIPAKRNPFLLVFLPAWLVGWAIGWGAAASQLNSSGTKGPADLFLVVWLLGWSAGGVFAIRALAWSLAGRELVTLRPHELVIARKALGLGRVRQYDLAHVSNLRVATDGYNPFDLRASMRVWGIGGGPIAFDYGASTVRFGASLEEGEAGQLVRRLLERQPSLGRTSAA
jgi:hypothetical protein